MDLIEVNLYRQCTTKNMYAQYFATVYNKSFVEINALTHALNWSLCFYSPLLSD